MIVNENGGDRDLSEAFGLALRQARESVHMKVTDLAAALGLDKSTVSKWESAENVRPPERAEVMKVADALDVNPGPLLRAAGYRYAIGEEAILPDELKILETLRGLSDDARERVTTLISLESSQGRRNR